MIDEERQIRDYASRPRRYVNVDGINELTCGLIFLGFAFFNSIPWLYLGWVPLVYFGGQAIKKRITYPRTGYVAYRRKQGPLVAFIGGAVALCVAVYAFKRYPINPVTFGGTAMLLLYLMAAWPLRPWKWLIAALMAAGVVFLPPDLPTPLRSVFFSLPVAVSGAISFWLYLRHTQPPSEASE
jgi:peptidoglycan/LPS O-acetylase OafA/YrhL